MVVPSSSPLRDISEFLQNDAAPSRRQNVPKFFCCGLIYPSQVLHDYRLTVLDTATVLDESLALSCNYGLLFSYARHDANCTHRALDHLITNDRDFLKNRSHPGSCALMHDGNIHANPAARAHPLTIASRPELSGNKRVSSASPHTSGKASLRTNSSVPSFIPAVAVHWEMRIPDISS